MRIWLLVIAFLVGGVTAVSAQTQRWVTPQANQYWHLKQERIDAYRTRDRAAMDRLLSPTFIGMSPSGQHSTREQYLAAEFPPESAAGPPTETEVTEFNVTRTGSTLVLTYRETERTNVAGQIFEAHLARLDVYVRQGGRWLLQTMSAVRLPEAPRTIEVSAARLADYVGVYQYGPGVTSTVRLADGRLMEQSTGNPEVEMLPVGADEFYSPPDLEARAHFERDASGRVTAQVYRSGAQTLRAPRVQ